MAQVNPWLGKTVLVTGCCGTIGRELLAQLVKLQPHAIIGIDNNETALFFQAETYGQVPSVRCLLGDVRDRDTLANHCRNVDVLLHTAAFKHVILCEQSPSTAVATNITGTQNVIEAALTQGVSRVLFTSSDKAVNPTNVMGTSKLMGERLITAANALRTDAIFSSTRFGNVLGSSGSVVPIFHKQIRAGGPLTLTDPNMTRFIMNISQAVGLVLDSVWLARGGEVFVTRMPALRIADLAKVMIDQLAPRYGYRSEEIEIQTIGAKAGEKCYEELMNEEEVRRAVALPNYFAVTPAFREVYADIHFHYPEASNEAVCNAYNSRNQPALSHGEIADFLEMSGLLSPSQLEVT